MSWPCFALSSREEWKVEDDQFILQDFYDAILKLFEDEGVVETLKMVEEGLVFFCDVRNTSESNKFINFTDDSQVSKRRDVLDAVNLLSMKEA